MWPTWGGDRAQMGQFQLIGTLIEHEVVNKNQIDTCASRWNVRLQRP